MGNISLSIAASGLNAQQTAMDTVAENLANVNTPGYIEEIPTMVAAPNFSLTGEGAGVTTLAASQSYDGLLETNNQEAAGALAQTSSLQQVLEGVQSAFPVSTTVGISADLASFWSSWDSLSHSPSSPADQTGVVDAAQNVVTDLASASNQIATTSANAISQLDTQVASDNGLLSDVASLNQQIVVTGSSGSSTSALVDQQSQILGELATDLGAVGTVQSNGTTSVSVAGITVVQGDAASTLQVSGSAGSLLLSTSNTTPATASGTTVPAASGTAAGLLAGVNQYLPAYQAQLDSVANDLATTVNTQLSAGYTAAGVSGTALPLFTGSGAAGLTVNPTVVADPTQIAASATATDAANNGANAQAMAALGDVTTGPDQAYRVFVQGMGLQVAGITTQVQTQTSVANAAQETLASVSGVDTTDQEVLMLNYQQAYQASATVISTVNTMMQSLLSAV